MILGAAIDAGVSIDVLRNALDALGIKGFSILSKSSQRGGVVGTQVSVEVVERRREPRRWTDFLRIIEMSSLPKKVSQRACAVFNRLAEGEAMAHGTTPENTYLHELGDLDTLVDVVGSILALDILGVERLYSSPFPSGSGIIHSEHGILPVPSPATAALFAMAKAPLVPAPGNATDTGEMVTPTGAAILTTLATFQQPSLNLSRVGYGLGSRESLHYPNALALWIGEETKTGYSTNLTIIETNLDDSSGELLGYVQEQLFKLGARDVWFTSIQMKKNRPGTMLSSIVPLELESQAIGLVLRETSTLGVRVRPVTRYEAERESIDIDTSLGPMKVKVKYIAGKPVTVSPEYEFCRRLAIELCLPLQDVYSTVQREAEAELLEHR